MNLNSVMLFPQIFALACKILHFFMVVFEEWPVPPTGHLLISLLFGHGLVSVVRPDSGVPYLFLPYKHVFAHPTYTHGI